jgi:hypothetical protein
MARQILGFTVFILAALKTWAQIPPELLGNYYTESYTQNGEEIPVRNYGRIGKVTQWVNDHTEVYEFAFGTMDNMVQSIDSLGVYEAAYYGYKGESVAIIKNEIKTSGTSTEIESLIRFGDCERPTRTHVAYDSNFTKIRVLHTMKSCKGIIYEREILYSR